MDFSVGSPPNNYKFNTKWRYYETKNNVKHPTTVDSYCIKPPHNSQHYTFFITRTYFNVLVVYINAYINVYINVTVKHIIFVREEIEMHASRRFIIFTHNENKISTAIDCQIIMNMGHEFMICMSRCKNYLWKFEITIEYELQQLICLDSILIQSELMHTYKHHNS